jgi:hypothetical protein
MWNHQQPHNFTNVTQLTELMRLNQDFAKVSFVKWIQYRPFNHCFVERSLLHTNHKELMIL